jgi:D-alanyl-D-alanine carboxypeptidase
MVGVDRVGTDPRLDGRRTRERRAETETLHPGTHTPRLEPRPNDVFERTGSSGSAAMRPIERGRPPERRIGPSGERAVRDARYRTHLAAGHRVGHDRGPLPASELQRVLDRGRGAGLGATAGVHLEGRGDWFGGSGRADPARSAKLDPNARFRIGSISKTFTATLAMQQVERGQLNLDDKISKWFPNFPRANAITVRQLLNHTSGIPDYLRHPSTDRISRGPVDPQRFVDLAAGMKRTSKPGQEFNYSNTNYTMASMILEKTGGKPIHEQLRENILEPLGMKDTFLDGKETIPAPGMVRGTVPARSGFKDVTNDVHPSALWGDGGLVSNTSDLLRFSRGLFGGKLVSAESLRQMTTPPTLANGRRSAYGLGLRVQRTPEGPRYSHYGLVPGFTASLSYLPSRGLHLATMTNTEVDPPYSGRIADGIERLFGR